MTLDVNGFFSHMIGAYGLAPEALDAIEPRLRGVLEEIRDRREQGELPFHDRAKWSVPLKLRFARANMPAKTK